MTEFRNRIAELDGQTMQTEKLRRSSPVHVLDPGLELTPGSTGRIRRVPWRNIERMLDQYNTTGSLDRSDYQNLSRNSSYLIQILKQLL